MADESTFTQLYNSFTDWLSYRTQYGRETKQALESRMGKDWYSPGEDAETITREQIEQRFNRDDIQDDYKKWVKGNGVTIDAVVTRFQNAQLAADERAFRVRHATIPQALAHGSITPPNTWSVEIYPELYKAYVKAMIDRSKTDESERFA